MNIEEFRDYCLAKKGATEDFPFDRTTLVLKAGGKMFAITDLETDFRITLKCNPEKAIDLRERYVAVQPGYHTNKKHWNTVAVDGTVSDALLKEWIDHSYELVTAKMKL